MSPFKKSGRRAYYVWPTLPGFDRVGPWSTGTSNKALAASVERWLREIALTDPEIVRGILARRYTLRDAYVAHKEARLDALKAAATDPPLKDVVARYRATVRDRRQRNGLELLERHAPRGVRFSWLTVPKHITDLLSDAVASGQRVNSVYRSLYAAVKGILVYQVGNARKRAITADVQFRIEDDSRDVELTPEQIRRLLDACDEALRPLVTVAILTGVDRGPLLRLTPAHVDFSTGALRVFDTKNQARQRTLELSGAALAVLATQAAGRADNARIFDLTEGQATVRFAAARKDAGLPWLRFKDLRHVFAGAWVQTGGALKDLGGVLGHTIAATTLRYTAKQARAVRVRMDSVADHLGLGREHLRLEKDGSA